MAFSAPPETSTPYRGTTKDIEIGARWLDINKMTRRAYCFEIRLLERSIRAHSLGPID